MYKNCKLIFTNYYYKSITNTLALQINKKHVRTLLVITMIIDIAYNLLERNSITRKVESLSPQLSTEDQMKKVVSADFLIHMLTNDPERSEYFRQSPPKGIRTSFFFITVFLKTSMSDINADDMVNNWNLVTRTSFIYCDNNWTSIVPEDVRGKFHYKERLHWNSHKKVYIPLDKIVKLRSTYNKAKIFPLTRTVIQESNSASHPPNPLLRVSTKLVTLLKKTKFHVTEMPPKILNQIFGRPNMFCKKLDKNVWMG